MFLTEKPSGRYKQSGILSKAFLFGIVCRALIEICNGEFPVGYDPNTWYVLMCVCEKWDYISDAPLYSVFVYLLYLAMGNALVAVKLGAVLVSGFFTFSLAYWALRYIVKETYALKFVVFVYTFFVILRILWDLHRNVVGIALSLLALAFYRDGKNLKAFLLSILAGIGHPYSLIFLGAGILYELLTARDLRVSLLALGVSIGVSLVAVIKILLGFPIINVFESYWYVSKAELPLYILWLYAPIIPIVIVLIYKASEFARVVALSNFGKKLATWILFTLAAAFFLQFTYRIVFLAAFPILVFMFILTEGINNRQKVVRLLILYNVVVSAVYPAISYVYPLEDSFRKTFPPALVGGNGFPWQLLAVKELFRKALGYLNESSAIIVHHAEISCAYAAGVPLRSRNVLVTYPDDDFEEYLNLAKLNGFRVVYIVWYIRAPVGSIEAPAGGSIVASIYDIALYKYLV